MLKALFPASPFTFGTVRAVSALAFVLCVSPWGAAQQHFVSAEVSASPETTPAFAAGAPDLVRLGSINGIVKDTSDVSIAGAVVRLATGQAETLSAQSDDDGRFSFPDVAEGPYKLTVEIAGFQPWTTEGTLQRGQAVQMGGIALAVSRVETEVEVVASSRDIAAAQLGFQEKQRVLGVFPNFYASYIWDAQPLTAGQKFGLALRFSTDPVAFWVAGTVAGGEQWQNGFRGYHQGTAGFAKRFGATYADGFTSTMLGQAILPAVFHQDPRYFVKGTGSVPSRALYAIATAVICKGDNHHWQLNYSNILGNVASASLSNLYYPATSRDGAGLTVENSLVGTAFGAVGGLIQEFFLHRMTPSLPEYTPRTDVQ